MLIVEKSENILGCSLPVPQPERARVHIPTRGSFQGDILLVELLRRRQVRAIQFLFWDNLNINICMWEVGGLQFFPPM